MRIRPPQAVREALRIVNAYNRARVAEQTETNPATKLRTFFAVVGSDDPTVVGPLVVEAYRVVNKYYRATSTL